MLISSKGRYALRLMIYIAALGDVEGKIALREVADREHISQKYLEQLVRPLMKAGLLKSVRGKGGGYMMAKDPSEVRAGDILRAVEGSTAPVACDGIDNSCTRSDLCSTVKFWRGLDDVIEKYVDGVTLAESLQQEDGTYARSYPNGNMAAHVVGYVSQQYGTAGVESVMNETLTGSKDYSSWDNALASLAGQNQPGNTAKLTIDSRIQTAAEQALKGFKGAVVVMDPRTGAVLACASSPTYDNTNIDALMQSGGGEDGSMYDRAMDALYTPGSTFKVVTLSAALETGTASLTSTYQAPGSMDIGNAPVTNDANESYGTISLQQAFAVSSNVVFGQVANEIGASSLVQFANVFGYGQKLGQDLTTAASIMADPSLMTEWETAWAGAGQPVGMDHTPGPQTTVMQNCVIAAAIANSGVVMDPFFVAQVLAPDGTVVKTTQSRSLGQAVSATTADQVKQAMLAVVQSGTGTDAQIPGVKVAGKTGSAETGGTNVNSMFVGFAPYDSPTVAISVALEDYDKHDVQAAKIAGIVLTAALAAQGA